MKATVDKDTCIGCGVCVDVCPQIFSMDQDDKAEAKDITVPGNIEESCQDAADQCPVEAIEIIK
ncbi:MAG TPA: ferredoxin [Treponema sp.]|nr:ferredoxin [Treponema sp.]